MYSQFRAQYPQGTIKTELLPHKVDGLHVFRAAIAAGEIILSTATAADSDLEVAEDRAVQRALVLAGISTNSEMRATLMPPETRAIPRYVPEPPQISASLVHDYEEQPEPARVKPSKKAQPDPSPPEYSKVIAGIDVELMRLGWDAEKGRAYLKATYNKNSRSQLSPEQLQEFFDYLQSIPSQYPAF
ncbi:MAG: hypothetical protein SFT94_03150 [Pseudanabaenaceae cyanobacterium bins.68]|nr:hypothetical protein [Pseudanabaenaceae cyanobacterium bins.68]